MRRRTKIFLWMIPILGVIFGFAYASIDVHGLAATWHFIGNPSEKVGRIIGVVGGHNLFVETDTGNVYSLEYYNNVNGRDSLPTHIEWNKEEI